MNKKIVCAVSILLTSVLFANIVSAYYFSLDLGGDKALFVNYTEIGSCYDMSLEYYDGKWWCMFLYGVADTGHSASGQRYKIINATNFLDLNYSSAETVEPLNPSNIVELGQLWHNPYDDLLYCFYGEFAPGTSNYRNAVSYYKTYNGTTDTWSAPVFWSNPISISGTQYGHYFSGSKPIVIDHGGSDRLLWSITYHTGSQRRCGILYSDDYGQTWENDSGGGRIYISNDDYEEPYLVECTNGTIAMYMRHSTDKGSDSTWHVFRSYSTDDGMTWSNGVRTDVTSAVSKNHVSKWTIDGNAVYLMVNNYRPELSDADPWSTQRERTNLTIRLSTDGWNWDNCTLYNVSATIPFIIDPLGLGQGYDGTWGKAGYPDCYVKDDIIHVVVYHTHDDDGYGDQLYGYEIYLNDFDSLPGISFNSINGQGNNTQLITGYRYFNWTKVVNASKYHLQIANGTGGSPDWGDIFVDLSNISLGCELASLPGGSYTEYDDYVEFYLPYIYNISWYGSHFYRVRAYTTG